MRQHAEFQDHCSLVREKIDVSRNIRERERETEEQFSIQANRRLLFPRPTAFPPVSTVKSGRCCLLCIVLYTSALVRRALLFHGK